MPIVHQLERWQPRAGILVAVAWTLPVALVAAYIGFLDKATWGPRIPWVFGCVALVATVLPIAAGLTWLAWTSAMTRRSVNWTWDDFRAVQDDWPAWWQHTIGTVERSLTDRDEPELSLAAHDAAVRLVPKPGSSLFVSALVIVGIVFTFDGIQQSAQGLRSALAVAPKVAAEKGKSALPRGPSTAVLQDDIGKALEPLQRAFGANLVGIVFAIVLIGLSAVQRQTSHALTAALTELITVRLQGAVARVCGERRKEAAVRRARRIRRRDALLRQSVEHLAEQRALLANFGTLAAQRMSEAVGPILQAQLSPILAAQHASLTAIAASNAKTAAQTARAVGKDVAEHIAQVHATSLEQVHALLKEMTMWSEGFLSQQDEARKATKATVMALRTTLLAQQEVVSGAAQAVEQVGVVVPALDAAWSKAIAWADREGRSALQALQAAEALATRTQTVAAKVEESALLFGETASAQRALLGELTEALGRQRTAADLQFDAQGKRLAAAMKTGGAIAERTTASADRAIAELASLDGRLAARVAATTQQLEERISASRDGWARKTDAHLASTLAHLTGAVAQLDASMNRLEGLAVRVVVQAPDAATEYQA